MKHYVRVKTVKRYYWNGRSYASLWLIACRIAKKEMGQNIADIINRNRDPELSWESIAQKREAIRGAMGEIFPVCRDCIHCCDVPWFEMNGKLAGSNIAIQ